MGFKDMLFRVVKRATIERVTKQVIKEISGLLISRGVASQGSFPEAKVMETLKSIAPRYYLSESQISHLSSWDSLFMAMIFQKIRYEIPSDWTLGNQDDIDLMYDVFWNNIPKQFK
ncbi:MAG: hypothetical protein ABSF90_25300 [Syntrophobacteraceae bacterium]|jgi:uncharacterized radical SAM superfamily protein